VNKNNNMTVILAWASALAWAGFAAGALAQPVLDPHTAGNPPDLITPVAGPPVLVVAPEGQPPSLDGVAASAVTSTVVVNRTMTNGPVPDTAANRARYGGPLSNAGKKSEPRGN
jgi:hypothetical protein